MSATFPPTAARSRWQRFASACVRGFHVYGSWLVGISWRRFVLLAALLVASAAILETIPPFSWTFTETIEEVGGKSPKVVMPPPPAPPAAPLPEPVVKVEPAPRAASAVEGLDISIDKRGIRIQPRAASAGEGPETAASGPQGAASEPDGGVQVTVDAPGMEKVPAIVIRLPEGSTRAEIDAAIHEARATVREAMKDARDAAREAAEAAREAARDAAEAAQDGTDAVEVLMPIHRTRTVHLGDFLTDLAILWVFASAILKATYKGRVQAEVTAAAAVQTAAVAMQTAEAEQLRRQVVEARMAAMQAQVEPHFLFNTLASIDHLIETDAPRASAMQKNLIALLRASMPTMREANDGGVRPLEREVAVIRPYLEILKVRMEERLTTEIQVPDGLLSAQFPPMMIQTLVENAIKHGLEPKPEGGHLRVAAEVVHGKLVVTVADTGVGFGQAATAGTGVGLANIRERLDLLYGSQAALQVTQNTPSGTVVRITVPYKSVGGAAT